MKKLSWLLYITMLAIPALCDDYCSICSDHTMCIYPAGAKDNCKDKELSSSDKDTIVDMHNKWRSKVARGKEKNQPSASNMRRLNWDSELAEIATRWVQQCKTGHDACRKVSRFAVGQNYAGSSSPDIGDLITLWYNEVNQFKGSVDNYNFDQSTGHYTQIVWALTNRIGCGMVYTGSMYNLICNYGPSGNVMGRPIYERGTAASKCPSGTSADGTYSGLCSDALRPAVVSGGGLFLLWAFVLGNALAAALR